MAGNCVLRWTIGRVPAFGSRLALRFAARMLPKHAGSANRPRHPGYGACAVSGIAQQQAFQSLTIPDRAPPFRDDVRGDLTASSLCLAVRPGAFRLLHCFLEQPRSTPSDPPSASPPHRAASGSPARSPDAGAYPSPLPRQASTRSQRDPSAKPHCWDRARRAAFAMSRPSL